MKNGSIALINARIMDITLARLFLQYSINSIEKWESTVG